MTVPNPSHAVGRAVTQSARATVRRVLARNIEFELERGTERSRLAMAITLIEANQRIEAALRSKDPRELRWSLDYSRTQLRDAGARLNRRNGAASRSKRFWRERIAQIEEALRAAAEGSASQGQAIPSK
jgi:hypothetical protein